MRAADLRVGWCPGALRPMASGDGLIVRVKPRGGALTPEAALGIAAAAARHGNGLLDLTARANLQIRGAEDATLPGLVEALDALGLLDADAGAEARRNVVASPLAGLDPSAKLDIRPAVAALEARLAAATGLADLPDKVGFAVSDGGALPPGGVSADVRFAAVRDGDGAARFAVRLDGDDGVAALCDADAVAEVAVRLAGVLVAAASGDPTLRRMRDLVARVGAASVLAQAGLEPAGPVETAVLSPASAGVPPAPVGRIDVAGLPVLGVAAPFGRLDAAALDILARGTARAGVATLRLTPWRAVLVPGLAGAAADRLAADCAAAGLIVDPADPRLRVAACVGAPGCRRASTPVLDHAARWAKLLASGDAGHGIALHVSGCAKGCAHPGPASLTLVAREGAYALVADGSADGPPVAAGLDPDEVRRLLKTILRQDCAP